MLAELPQNIAYLKAIQAAGDEGISFAEIVEDVPHELQMHPETPTRLLKAWLGDDTIISTEPGKVKIGQLGKQSLAYLRAEFEASDKTYNTPPPTPSPERLSLLLA